MNVFAYELKKIMLHQKGLLYIIAFLLISTLLLIMTDTPESSAMEQYRDEYEWYLESLEGVCTEEAVTFLDEEAAAIAETTHCRSELLEMFYSGKLTKDEYEQRSKKFDMITEHENGFEVIYQQYLYICENMDNRYFLQTNGWSGLFRNDTLDFPFFLVVLLLATSVFCSEYSCKMDALIRTSKDGSKSIRYKFLIILLSVLLLCILTALIRYGFYAVKYGLPHGDYPMQSISSFGNSTKAFSLMRAYLLVIALRCFGFVFFAVMMLLFTAWVKKYALSVLLGAISVLIPYIGLSRTVLCRLPMPIAFMLSTDLLAGSIYTSDPLTGETVAVFREITSQELVATLLLSFIIVILAVLWLSRLSRNHWQNHRKTGINHSIMAGILSVLLLFGGCTSDTNKFEAKSDWTNKYTIIQSETEQNYYLEDYKTGEKLDLVRSPLFSVFSEKDCIKGCYEKSPYIYCITSKTESYINRVGSFNSSNTIVSVVELNTETMCETVIFEQIMDSGRSLLGIEYEVGNKWAFLNQCTRFFVNERSIFFVHNNSITEVNRKTHRLNQLDIDADENLAFDGQYFYYTDEQAVLNKYDTFTHLATAITDVIAYDFCLQKESIYYISLTDKFKVFQCSISGENQRILFDKPALSISCDGTKISITPKESQSQIIIEFQNKW